MGEIALLVATFAAGLLLLLFFLIPVAAVPVAKQQKEPEPDDCVHGGDDGHKGRVQTDHLAPPRCLVLVQDDVGLKYYKRLMDLLL